MWVIVSEFSVNGQLTPGRNIMVEGYSKEKAAQLMTSVKLRDKERAGEERLGTRFCLPGHSLFFHPDTPRSMLCSSLVCLKLIKLTRLAIMVFYCFHSMALKEPV